MDYFRPVIQSDPIRPKSAYGLRNSNLWFDMVEHMERGKAGSLLPAKEMPKQVLEDLTQPRADIAGLDMQSPKLMGVLNVTPDSFSDGGLHYNADDAVKRGLDMFQQGADIVDIGGESTRPGADFVENSEEQNRIEPVVEGLSKRGVLSIDTRKAPVAQAAINGGVEIFNDVSALSFDPDSLAVAAQTNVAVCLMHASGDPKTMQDNPEYGDVVLDVYDYLAERIALCLKAGISKEKIIVDPGIGFGKTTAHNLLLIRKISLFHALGCPILLGVSRKRFIGEIGEAQNAADRLGGSLAVALEGLQQGVQILRVHDVAQTKQAMRLFDKMKLGADGT